VPRHSVRQAVTAAIVLALTLAACGPGTGPAHRAAPLARWVRFRHVAGVVDIAGPGGHGQFAVAAAGRLFLWTPPGAFRPFARGPGGYRTAAGPEPYVTVAGTDQAAGTCTFRAGTIFALEPHGHPGVIAVGTDGRAKRFLSLPGTLTPTGIAFDTTGHFGHDLLVTARGPAGTTVLGVDCTGRARTIAAHAPAMEGGIAVAPASFGRYAGDLVAAGEDSGRIFAIAPSGAVVTLAASGLPRGGDIGVESTGFAPPGFGAGSTAYLADRYSPGNKHPGTNAILSLPGAELVKAGVRAGDLLAATEASARTIVVRCGRACSVRDIAIGPQITHAEGHIAFTGSGR
jgi:hypothetical protein